jgi:hypothetical protein
MFFGAYCLYHLRLATAQVCDDLPAEMKHSAFSSIYTSNFVTADNGLGIVNVCDGKLGNIDTLDAAVPPRNLAEGIAAGFAA